MSDTVLSFDAEKLVKRFQQPEEKDMFLKELTAMAETKAAAKALQAKHSEIMFKIRDEAHFQRMLDIGSPWG